MNELNYATQPASKRLLDAGIVLETENYWRIYGVDEDPVIELVTAKHRLDGWGKCNLTTYPAPMFTEVWRELPKNSGKMIKLMRDFYGDNVSTEFLFRRLFDIAHNVDFAVTLLIWVTEKKRKER